MPLSNPFRRAADRPTLRERAAELRASLAPAAMQIAPLPAPGSEEAMTAYRAAYREETIRSASILEAYPDLRRGPSEWWTASALSAAMEAGEVAPAECARLYPLATERELRLAEIAYDLNLGALHALAFAGSYDNVCSKPSTIPAVAPAVSVAKAAAADALSDYSISTPLRVAIAAHRDATVAMLTEADESDEATERATATVKRTGDAIRAIPAKSVADVRAKLALLLPEILPDVNGSVPTSFLENIQADLHRLAFEAAEAMAPHALSKAILDLWPAWAAYPSDEGSEARIYEHMQAHRFALINAADALPATRDAIIPKALALAWVDYVESMRIGWQRDDYSTDGRLALDIDAAATSRRQQPSAGVVAAPSHPQVTVVVSIDYASASIGTLQAIVRSMRHLSDAAHAMVPSSEEDWLPLGYLLVSLAEEISAVMDAAENEIQRRHLTDFDERRQQLAAVANRVIWNGDNAETAAFVLDLAAWAAEQARR